MSEPKPTQVESSADSSYEFTVERNMKASADAIYQAWTAKFDTWFASPGRIQMRAVENEPFFFEVVHQNNRHPHYGRFLRLIPNKIIELTWVTGKMGTEGAETRVLIQLTPTEAGTQLVLTHGGFYTDTARDRHQEAWPMILGNLDDHLEKAV
ncbi:activator of Hsp90 ATPase 1 family protein [Umbelopsis sp. PMI_123]|nr:activator of Hsp90 ATPase 1 family protein [Umbelopsis sp. PMI_123]